MSVFHWRRLSIRHAYGDIKPGIFSLDVFELLRLGDYRNMCAASSNANVRVTQSKKCAATHPSIIAKGRCILQKPFLVSVPAVVSPVVRRALISSGSGRCLHGSSTLFGFLFSCHVAHSCWGCYSRGPLTERVVSSETGHCFRRERLHVVIVPLTCTSRLVYSGQSFFLDSLGGNSWFHH